MKQTYCQHATCLAENTESNSKHTSLYPHTHIYMHTLKNTVLCVFFSCLFLSSFLFSPFFFFFFYLALQTHTSPRIYDIIITLQPSPQHIYCSSHTVCVLYTNGTPSFLLYSPAVIVNKQSMQRNKKILGKKNPTVTNLTPFNVAPSPSPPTITSFMMTHHPDQSCWHLATF